MAIINGVIQMTYDFNLVNRVRYKAQFFNDLQALVEHRQPDGLFLSLKGHIQWYSPDNKARIEIYEGESISEPFFAQ